VDGDPERDSPEYWFAAKRYGWGWDLPRTWQGWLVYAVYVCVLVLPAMATDGNLVVLTLAIAVATPVLFAVCWAKGEPPSWRWGGDRSNTRR
jgi:hypothetical protein